MQEKERGAIVVEATIGLTSFIFFVYILLTVINVCLAQAKIGVAVNVSAKELSQYSYLYTLTHVDKLHRSAAEKGELADGAVDDVVQGVEVVFDEIGRGENGESSLESVYDTGQTAYNKFKSGINTVSQDPKEFILSLAYATGTDVFNMALNSAGSELVRVLMQKNLKASSNGSVEDFLRYCRVVPKNGSCMNGIDMSRSEIFSNGLDGIKIFAEYDISLVRLLNTDIKFHLSACGETKAWSVGEATAEKQLTAGGGEGGGQGNGNAKGNADEVENNEDLPADPSVETTENEETTTAETTTKREKSKQQLAKEATHYPNGEYVVIGKYNDVPRYTDVAEENGFTYFELENYDELLKEKGEEEMWLINAEFLQQQINQGKSFILTADPDKATGSYAKEVRYLKDHGYEFVEEGPYIKAVKKKG